MTWIFIKWIPNVLCRLFIDQIPDFSRWKSGWYHKERIYNKVTNVILFVVLVGKIKVSLQIENINKLHSRYFHWKKHIYSVCLLFQQSFFYFNVFFNIYFAYWFLIKMFLQFLLLLLLLSSYFPCKVFHSNDNLNKTHSNRTNGVLISNWVSLWRKFICCCIVCEINLIVNRSSTTNIFSHLKVYLLQLSFYSQKA